MQTANILLSLGGDNGNTIMKWGVTAAEIAVLRAIHGDDSVNDVEPVGNVSRSHREERARLIAIYGGAKNAEQRPIVEGMFPGVAARVFENIEELDLDESMFKSTSRLSAPAREEKSFDPETPPLTQEQIDAEKAAADEAEAEEGAGDDIDDEHSEKPSVLD